MKLQFYLSLCLLFIISQTSYATTFTAVVSGNWGDGSTWDQAGAVPGSGDDVVIMGYTVLLGDYTGDVTVKYITLTNISGANDSRLLIYENVTLNASSITLDAENREKNVELQIYGQAEVIISGKLKLDRKSDNNKTAQLLFLLHGSATVTVGNDFEYNYLNGNNSEAQEEIRIEGSAQLNLNGNLVLTKASGGGEFNMIIAGGADIYLTGQFNIYQQAGGDFNVTIQDSTTFTIGGTSTFQNKSGVNQLNITIDQLEGFVYFTDEVHFDSNNDDNLIIMEAYGNSILKFIDDLRMTGGTEEDIGLILGDTAQFHISGRLLRPDKYGFIQSTDESLVVFNGAGTPTIDYSNLANSGKDSIYIPNIALNNTSGSPVELTADFQVDGHLELISGILQTSPSALLIVKDGATISAGSSTAYVDGPIVKKGSTNGSSFVFPTGKSGVYAPLEISPVSNSSHEYQAQYFSDPPPIEDGISPPLGEISSAGHWSLAKGAGAADVDVSLHWSDAAASGINDPDSLLVAGLKDNGATKTWESYGNGGTTGGTGSGVGGSVTTALSEPPPLDDVTFLTIGTVNGGLNALPVTMTRFGAVQIGDEVQVTWETIAEEDADRFVIERSTDGKSFVKLDEIAANGSSFGSNYYKHRDMDPSIGVNYYRLKQIDYDGRYAYSEMISVRFNSKKHRLQVYPNPVVDVATVQGFSDTQKEIFLTVEDQNGRKLFSGAVPVESGRIKISSFQLNMDHRGVYYLQFEMGNDRRTIKLIKIK